MSAPAFAWALERGAALGLKPADRLVLIYLADMANGEKVCWPGQPKIMRFTGLKMTTVREAVRRLADRQLIAVEAHPGVVTRYRILRPDTPSNGHGVDVSNPHKPAQGYPDEMAQGTPPKGHGVPDEMAQGDPVPVCAEPRTHLVPTPPNGHTDPSITQVRDPRKTRVSAREGAGFKNSEPQGGTPPPAPPLPRAPTIGATDGGGNGYRKPVPGASAYAPVEEARAVFADYLAGLRQDRAAAKPAQPDRRADTTAVKRAVGATIYSLRKYAAAPGVAPIRSRAEQINRVLVGEVLSPIRRGPVEADRTPEQQYAQLMGISLAEAARAFGHTVEATP